MLDADAGHGASDHSHSCPELNNLSAASHASSDMPSASALESTETLNIRRAQTQCNTHMSDDDDDDDDDGKSILLDPDVSHIAEGYSHRDRPAAILSGTSCLPDVENGADDCCSIGAEDCTDNGPLTVSIGVSSDHASADVQCSRADGHSSAAAESIRSNVPPSSAESAVSTAGCSFPTDSSTSSCSYSTLSPEDCCDPCDPPQHSLCSMLFPEDDCCQPKSGFQPCSNK